MSAIGITETVGDEYTVILDNSEIRRPLVTCGAADLLSDACLLRGVPSGILAQGDLSAASCLDVRKLS